MKLVCSSPCRLDSFLAGELKDHSRTRLAELITSGAVTVEGKPRKPSFKLEAGMSVELSALPENRPAHDLTPADIPLHVLFEDGYLLVVNKPRGMATHPAPSLKEPSLVNALLARGKGLSEAGGAFRPGIVHRLDKATTGLIVVAKTDAAHHALARQFADKTAGRTYLAWVAGEFGQPELRIEAPIGRDPKNRTRMAVDPKGKPAATLVRVLKGLNARSLIECRLETGRTHQIRVHLAALGHPVVGDAVYNRSPGEHPLQLHAARLEFEHPESGKRLEFSVAPPEDFIDAESGVS
ncbi:MAG: RluA family pseudouridine synthase [Armatimonadetes bacterium]|nr:RluA family pseudouridine synthase [Armatimonadota bacterium]